jgi:hypothetical protein
MVYAVPGNNREVTSFILERRNIIPVIRQPMPYLKLGQKWMEEASGKYLVGQVISEMV